MRVTFVLSEGFLKMARASWYILFLEEGVVSTGRVDGCGEEGMGRDDGGAYGVIPVPPAIKAI